MGQSAPALCFPPDVVIHPSVHLLPHPPNIVYRPSPFLYPFLVAAFAPSLVALSLVSFVSFAPVCRLLPKFLGLGTADLGAADIIVVSFVLYLMPLAISRTRPVDDVQQNVCRSQIVEKLVAPPPPAACTWWMGSNGHMTIRWMGSNGHMTVRWMGSTVDGIQVHKVITASQNKSNNVWI
jgi:hypothetical protein